VQPVEREPWEECWPSDRDVPECELFFPLRPTVGKRVRHSHDQAVRPGLDHFAHVKGEWLPRAFANLQAVHLDTRDDANATEVERDGIAE